jgi:hypothetical protein
MRVPPASFFRQTAGFPATWRQALQAWKNQMAIETIGKYQAHLFAYELPESGRWEPFLKIDRFDDQAQDFKCVVDNRRAGGETFESYDAAIEEARRVANKLILEQKP